MAGPPDLSIFEKTFAAGHLKAPGKPKRARISWPDLLPQAAGIVGEYSTGVTLRQLFYQLVARQLLENKQTAYASLSHYTAEARRYDGFPALIEGGRPIHIQPHWSSPEAALAALRVQYRRDRTEGQPVKIILGVEKTGMIEQLRAWFGKLGLPIFATSGYSSQTLESAISDD